MDRLLWNMLIVIISAHFKFRILQLEPRVYLLEWLLIPSGLSPMVVLKMDSRNGSLLEINSDVIQIDCYQNWANKERSCKIYDTIL